MIEGLDSPLDPYHDRHLRELLLEVLGGARARGRVLERSSLVGDRVWRWKFELECGVRSLVSKRLPLERSSRERAAITRWLPRAGFPRHTARLLGVSAQAHTELAWHVYEDLGERTLEHEADDPRCLAAAVELVAGIHMRFATNPFLAECRLLGADLGAGFLVTSTTDALRGLEGVRRVAGLSDARRNLVEGLLNRLTLHRSEQPQRLHALLELGWPETLLHGDLWPTNIVVTDGSSTPGVCLIDWEYAGVGPAIYDLSTLLRRLPARHRQLMLDTYKACVASAGWDWPDDATLAQVAETIELGRFANDLIWSAMDVLQAAPAQGPDWAFQQIADVEAWFGSLTPLLGPGSNPEVPVA